MPKIFNAPLRGALVATTFAVFLWYFLASSGENIQRMTWDAIPLAAWWTLGASSVLAVCRPIGLAVVLWAAALGVSLKVLFDIYASTSSTAGIGLLLVPPMAGATGILVAALANWMASSPDSSC
jgi:uncharacterized membrane protein YeiH